MFLFLTWISFILSFVNLKELSISSQNITILKSTVEPLQFKLRFNQEHIVATYPNHESTISLTIKDTDQYDETFCYAVPKKIVFDDFQNRAQQVLDNSKPIENKQRPPDKYQVIDPSEQLSTPMLVNMVHTTQGFAIVTSDHYLLIYSINNSVNDSKTLFKATQEKKIKFSSTSKEVPQLAYDPSTLNIYIIYQTEVLQANLKDLNSIQVSLVQLANWNQKSRIGNVRIAHQHLFIPMGNNGLKFYKIEVNGLLTYSGNIDSNTLYNKFNMIDIVDIAFGGVNGEHMYVLDRTIGISLFEIEFTDNNSINLHLDNQFGLIIIYGGTVIKEFNNTMIMVLCELVAQTYLFEVGLNLVSKEWFYVKTHYLFGHFSDIEISDSFAILRGVDSHLVVYHSIWQGFQPSGSFFFRDDWMKEEKYRDFQQYLVIPSLKSMKFYSENYGLGNPRSWHYNMSHPFLIAITGHSIIEMPWIQVDPYIGCLVYQPVFMGTKKKYLVELNSTQCQQKQELMSKNNNLLSQLILCSQDQQIEVEVEANRKILAWEWKELGLGILLLVMLVLLALRQVYQRHKLKQQKLNEEIKKFQDRGYETSDQKQ